MTDASDAYDRLVQVRGCGPKTAERIQSKIANFQDLTDKEYDILCQAGLNVDDKEGEYEEWLLSKKRDEDTTLEIERTRGKKPNANNSALFTFFGTLILIAVAAQYDGTGVAEQFFIFGSTLVVWLVQSYRAQKWDNDWRSLRDAKRR